MPFEALRARIDDVTAKKRAEETKKQETELEERRLAATTAHQTHEQVVTQLQTVGGENLFNLFSEYIDILSKIKYTMIGFSADLVLHIHATGELRKAIMRPTILTKVSNEKMYLAIASGEGEILGRIKAAFGLKPNDSILFKNISLMVERTRNEYDDIIGTGVDVISTGIKLTIKPEGVLLNKQPMTTLAEIEAAIEDAEAHHRFIILYSGVDDYQ